MRSLRTRLCALAAALLAALAGAPASAQTRPASYAEFDVSIAPGDGAALRAAVLAGQERYLFLQRGHYVLNNPVVIDRTSSLFIHGIDRAQVTLVARDPTQPLFLVRSATLVNFAGLTFSPSEHDASTLGPRAISTVNTQPIVLELQDCGVGRSALQFGGPGFYQIQSCHFAGLGMVLSPVLIDHPGADVFVFGGDGSNGEEPLRAADYAHFWQKRGRLRIYGTTVEGGLGRADIRLESRSTFGPHVIANVRSEGINGPAIAAGLASRLLYVPPTTERVDVLLKSNGGSWDSGPKTSRDARMNCKLVAYNGAGTLWLFGNRAEGPCGRHLVEGNAPEATIVSVGNLISSADPFPVAAKQVISASDQWFRSYWTGDNSLPIARWIPEGPARKLPPPGSVPQPPDDVLPPSIQRPALTAALPGMADVKSFGAKGDGTTDDTAALQRALDADCSSGVPKAVYFPAGTYRIRGTLYLNHHSGGSCRWPRPVGGWIAGAGSSRTILAMDPGIQRGVFASDGLALATIQGITFKTWAWKTGDPMEPNFDLEFYPGYLPTQLNNLYDVVFDGGYAGFATGVRRPTGAQCSSNVVFQGRFANAHFGLVAGHYNAAFNGAYDSAFVDNDYAIGAWTSDEINMPPGGNFVVYRSSSRGTRQRDFLLRGSASGTTFYAYEWTSDAPAFVTTGSSAGAWPVMLDRVRLTPRPGVPYAIDLGTAQGVFFLYSTATRAGIRIGQSGMSQNYAIKMQSEIADWGASIAPLPNGNLDAISWGAAAPASLGPPGQPKLAP